MSSIKVDVCFYAGILFSTLVFGPACGFILGSVCTKFYVDAIFIDTSEFNIYSVLHYPVCSSAHGLLTSACLSTGKLGITPDDPRWIGAWWAGFLLCGALLFSSALLMFGFPQSLPTSAKEEGLDSEQVMLPPSLVSDYETPKPSNGVVGNHEPVNSPTCCQQLRGECVRCSSAVCYVQNCSKISHIEQLSNEKKYSSKIQL